MAMMVGGGKPATRPKAENGRGDEAKHLGKPSTAMMKAAMKGKPTYTNQSGASCAGSGKDYFECASI